MQYENDEPCGYIIHGNGFQVCKVYQCCIQTDARRKKSASLLVDDLINKSRLRGSLFVSLWCAEDLESNNFWEALGFQFNGKRQGGSHRDRVHKNWVYDLDTKLI